MSAGLVLGTGMFDLTGDYLGLTPITEARIADLGRCKPNSSWAMGNRGPLLDWPWGVKSSIFS
jgi:hypothetical protein